MPLIPAPHCCLKQGEWQPELCIGNVAGHFSLQINERFFFRRQKKRSRGAARQWQPEGAAEACCQDKQGSHLM